MRSLMLLAAAFPSALSAQPVEIVVTGRGLDPAAGESVYSRSIIERERLTNSASGQLQEILRDVPGFQLFRRSDARSANPTSQGATLRALGGNASSRALLLLDGVPQNDPFGGWVYWPAYDPQRLGAVRVVRGGGTGADGPGALAGTIELISALPSEVRGLTADAAYGSRDSIDTHALYGADVGSGFVTASAAFARGDGFIPIVEEARGPVDRPSPYTQGSLSLRGIAPVGAATELQASLLLFRDERERGLPFTDNRTTGTDASLRLVNSGPLPFSILGYIQTRDYTNSFASTDDARTTANQVAEQFNVPSTGIGARAELRPRLGAFDLRLGGDWRETSGETRERYNFQNGAPTRGRVAGGRTRTLGAYAEAAREWENWTITAGGRIDRWWISEGVLRERVLATNASLTDTMFPDRSGWEPTGRAGAAWRPTEALTLRAAGYLGWRLPTLNELYRPFRVGPDATAANAELEPERLRGIEAAAELRPAPGVRASATIFANRLENAIANVTLGRGPGNFPGVGFVSAAGLYSQRQNLDAVDARGVEVDVSVERGAVTLNGGYSFVDAEVEASGAALALDGLRPAQTPRHTASATLAWRSEGGTRASFTARYTGNQFEDDLSQQLLPDALSFDAAALVPLTSSLAVQLRAENITDERIIAGVDSAGTLERATPRTFWIGLRFTP